MSSDVVIESEDSVRSEEQRSPPRRNAITSQSTELNALSSSFFYTSLDSELMDLASQSKDMEANKAFIRNSLQFPSPGKFADLEVSDTKKFSDEHHHSSQKSVHHQKSHHHGGHHHHHHKNKKPRRGRKEIVVNVKQMIEKAKEAVPEPMPGKICFAII